MSRIIRGFALFSILMTVGCSAQSAPSGNISPELKRKIELQIRNRFQSLPPSVTFEVGERKPSDVPGWDAIPVTLVSPRGKQTLDLLLSKDDKQMAHMERFNLDTVPGSTADLKGRPVRGNPNAKVTLLSYDDFQCPFCSVMHQKLFPALLTEYGSKVRFIYKDYPLDQIHPWAVRAAVNANCIAQQKNDAYWEYADYVHANQQKISKNDKGEKRPQVEQFNSLDTAAREIGTKGGLDPERLNACIKKQDDSAIRASMKEGDSLGVDGTPTIFINGERIGGDTDVENIRMILNRALVAAGEQPPQTPTATVTK